MDLIADDLKKIDELYGNTFYGMASDMLQNVNDNGI